WPPGPSTLPFPTRRSSYLVVRVVESVPLLVHLEPSGVLLVPGKGGHCTGVSGGVVEASDHLAGSCGHKSLVRAKGLGPLSHHGRSEEHTSELQSRQKPVRR